MKTFLPVTLDVTDKKILIIGGGQVAFHKIKFITPFTQNIEIIGREVCDEVKSSGIAWKEQPYSKECLEGAFLVYAATNDLEVNLQVKKDGNDMGLLVNLVDNPSQCDFVSPAIFKQDNMTVAVGSNGQDVMKAIKWRNIIRDFFTQSDKSNQ